MNSTSQSLANTIVVLLHHGDPNVTRRALERLRTLYPSPDAPAVLVVENGKPGVGELYVSGTELVALPENRGFGAGCNLGVRAAFRQGAALVVVLNNDVVLAAGVLEAMCAAAAGPGVGLVGASVLEREGTVIGGGQVRWWRGRSVLARRFQDAHDLHYVHGACLGITRACAEAVGAFREDLFLYWEDVDYGLRARAAGLRLVVADTALIQHGSSVSPNQVKTYYLVRNAVHVIRSRGPSVARWWIRWTLPLRIVLARLRGKNVVVRALQDAARGVTGQAPADLLGGREHAHQSVGQSAPNTQHPTPEVSIILVTHNAAVDIEQCLRALPAAVDALPYETIVVDAGSTDKTVAVTRTLHPTLFLEVPNLGFAAAANAGVAQAQGAFLLFLNPDTVLPPGSLTRLVEGLRAPGVVAVSGVLVNASGDPESVGEPFPSLWWYIRRRFWPARGRRQAAPTHSGPRPEWEPGAGGRSQNADDISVSLLLPPAYVVPWLSGAALLVRADAFRAVGGFDERYFLYYEDIDLCAKLRARGGDIVIDPSVRIRHLGGRSAPWRRRLCASDHSEDTYFFTHRPRWEAWALRFSRPLFRWVTEPLLFPAAAGLAAAAVLARDALAGTILALAGLAIVVSARVPAAGLVLLLSSVVLGQLVRIPVAQAGGLTVTDLLLPLVIQGWLLAWWARPSTGGRSAWLAVLLPAAALAPGFLLAAERLPTADLLIAGAYALRLLMLLLLVPLAAAVLKPVQVIRGVTATAVVLALLGFLQLIFVPLLRASPSCLLPPFFCLSSGWDPHMNRLFSTWLDPNLLGGFFAFVLSAVLVLPRRKSAWATMLWISAALLVGGALVLTKSRAAVLALAVAGAVGVILGASWRRLLPLVTAAALGLALVPSVAARLASVNSIDPTTALRLASWIQALEHSYQFPVFGLGYNAYGIEQLAVGNIRDLAIHSRAGADSSWLTFLATTGVWGSALLFIGFLTLVWCLIRRSVRERSLHPTSDLLSTQSVLLALVALSIHAQFVNNLTYVHLAVPLALMLGAVFHSSLRGARATKQSSNIEITLLRPAPDSIRGFTHNNAETFGS